jgi:hypothetical protein
MLPQIIKPRELLRAVACEGALAGVFPIAPKKMSVSDLFFHRHQEKGGKIKSRPIGKKRHQK